ncbi:cob(I)yrinic acid a,c-diamide adenosyltransferase [bacterium]|nr:cob(I)yrinic acid a,c-diamide adenosyltransferase [bacterium]
MRKELFNPDFSKRGYIQVYTGNGKGKTTASLGLALRALGRGWDVLMVMLAKGGNNYGELNSFKNLIKEIDNKLTIINAGLDKVLFKKNITEEDKVEIQKGWDIAKCGIQSGEYSLVILDEVNIAIDLGLIDVDEVVDVLKNKPDNVEVVLTGRRAHKKIIDIAHLVSEIKPVKHYWDIGVEAREGVEF